LKIAVRAIGAPSSGAKTNSDTWSVVADYARHAEKMGIDSMWSAEAWGTDALTPLAYLAAHTEKINLGTGIVQIGSRTPANLLMSSLTLQSMSQGRFLLGLGTSGPQVMEGWHGVSFSNPIGRTREILEIIKLGSRGQKLVYEGKNYTLPLRESEGKAIKSSLPPTNIPVYLASLGPNNLELTGELADGWIGGCFIPETAHVFMDRIKSGADKAGRSIGDLEIMVPVSLEFTDNVDEVGKRHARGYGFTFGAMGSLKNNFYKNAYSRQGYGEAVDSVQKLWLEGRRDEARDLVPVDLAVKSNLIGTKDMILDRLRLYETAGVTTLKVEPQGPTLSHKLESLESLMDLVSVLHDV
jgi:F420-dependent oxidoreductase-like protein